MLFWQRRIIRQISALLLFVLVGVLHADWRQDKIDGKLQQVLGAQKNDQELLRVYVRLADRLTLQDVRSITGYLPRKERQKAVAALLQSHAYATQSRVMTHLENEQFSKNAVADISNIWSINVIAFKARASVIYDLAAAYGEIERIYYDPIISAEEAQDDQGISAYNAKNGITQSPLFAPQPGLLLLNAPLVWAEGDSGQGVIVANCDSGTDWTHPDLVNNIWNNLGEDADGDGHTIERIGSNWVFDPGDQNGVDDDGNGYVDDFVGYDFGSNDNNPQDAGSHGTSTAGQVCGDGTNGTQTGVAPRATLMICKIEGGGQTDWWEAYQYAFANGVHVTTSSYSLKWVSDPDYAGFRNVNDMELAAGVVHTNSTGNQGNQGTPGCNNSYPVPYNISTPGNSPSPWMHPDQNSLSGAVSSVIGCGNVNAITDIIDSGSGLGPAAWENIQSRCPSYPFGNPAEFQDYPFNLAGTVEPDSIGLLKPDVSAPGASTTSTVPGGGYASFGGTSSATPHTAGVVALLLSVNPDLEPADISRILQTTAIEKGAPGKDVRYGAGRVDAYLAYLQAYAEAGAPNTPLAITAYSDYTTPDAMQLSWIPPSTLANGDSLDSDAFSMLVLRDGELQASVPGSQRAYIDSGLNDGQVYSYSIIAQVDSTGRESNPISTSWTAGGAPVPAGATDFSINGNQAEITLTWRSPSVNIDGTPLDDYAGIRLYQNGSLVETFERTSADTAMDDRQLYQVPAPGFYNWQITVLDNEVSSNESVPSETKGTPLSLPVMDNFSNVGAPNPGIWRNSNTEVNNRASTPPSGLLAVNLNGTPLGGDTLDLKALDISVFPETIVSFAWQPQGNGNAPEEGDSLLVYLKNSLEEWILVRAYPGTTVQPFQNESIIVSAEDAGAGTFFHGQFQLRFRSLGGASGFPNDDWFIDDVILEATPTGIADQTTQLPLTFELKDNYPNPFNPSTTIDYQLPERSEVKLVIYNMLGQKVRTLFDGSSKPGFLSLQWDGRNDGGSVVASGVYLLRFKAVSEVGGKQYSRTGKMILLK